MSDGWVKFLESQGVAATTDALHSAITADIFLLAAVEATDVHWCIRRLKQIRKCHGNLPTLLEAALPIKDSNRSSEGLERQEKL